MMDTSHSHILLVDDNPLNIQVLGGILRNHEYNISIASNGKSTLNFLETNSVDLILLDIMMPDMDGFEVLSHIQKDNKLKKIPVILLSALNTIEDKIKGFKCGAVDYIAKPFVKEEVIARINVHLRLSLALKQLQMDAITDNLTGVYNRRFADEIISKYLNIVKREDKQIILCLIDIDGLKFVNDNFGHTFGDELIKTITREISHSIRNSDYLFRLGGDEFLILLNNTDMSNLEIVIERINQSLANIKICDVTPDFSYGAVCINKDNEKSIDELIHECDNLMYIQKKGKKTNRETSVKEQLNFPSTTFEDNRNTEGDNYENSLCMDSSYNVGIFRL